MQDAYRSVLEHMETQEFRHWVKFGVIPGQEVRWPSTTIVGQLQLAESECQEEGWTNLAKARDFIQPRWPDLTPELYGCSSWRHVIHESQLFEIKKRRSTDSEAVQVWYRSKRSEH